MSRRMTVVFHDEDLYTLLKVEAARRHIPASNIITDAIREWIASKEDAELLPVIESARKEWQENGGRPWAEVEQEMELAINSRERKAQTTSVQA